MNNSNGANVANSTMGQIMSGGIAGVASKADSSSVKIVNDQKNYSLWEFYYDPTKDTSRGVTGNTLPGTAQSSGISSGFQQTPLFPNTQPPNATSNGGQLPAQSPTNPNSPPIPNQPNGTPTQ
jgi:hypothetical protein